MNGDRNNDLNPFGNTARHEAAQNRQDGAQGIIDLSNSPSLAEDNAVDNAAQTLVQIKNSAPNPVLAESYFNAQNQSTQTQPNQNQLDKSQQLGIGRHKG
jgi:hypothetical protein